MNVRSPLVNYSFVKLLSSKGRFSLISPFSLFCKPPLVNGLCGGLIDRLRVYSFRTGKFCGLRQSRIQILAYSMSWLEPASASFTQVWWRRSYRLCHASSLNTCNVINRVEILKGFMSRYGCN